MNKMDIYLSALSVLTALTICLVINYQFVGLVFNQNAKWNNPNLKFGISWFFLMGESGFSGLLSVTTRISPAVVFRILILSLFAYVIYRKGMKLRFSNFKNLFKFLITKKSIISLFITIFGAFAVLLMQTLNTARAQGLFTLTGTLHTGKFAFIADYIRNCDTVPKIQASWGQSLFVGLIGYNINISSVLLLYISLCGSILALSLFLSALLSLLLESDQKLKKNNQALATFLVICGNFALSLGFVQVNDSGNPILFNGYSDIVFGIFLALFIFLTIIKFEEINSKLLTVLLIGFISNSFIASPQILIVCLPSAFVLIIFRFRRSIYHYTYFAFTFLAGLTVWHGSTGMLISDVTKASQNFPAIGKLANKNFLNLFKYENISPGIPFILGENPDINREIYPSAIISAKFAVEDRLSPSRFLWDIEQIFLSTLRPIFWPLFGITILGFYILVINKQVRNNGIRTNFAIQNIILFWIYTLVSSCVGLFLAFFFAPNNLKWEMARFSFPVLILGLICLVLFLELKFSVGENLKLRKVIVFLLIFPTFLHFITALVDIPNRPEFIRNVSTIYGEIGFFEKPLVMNCENYANNR
jgi:hypothetical protein